MAATITRGITFSSTELVTNTKLHLLVDAATISGFDATNLVSGSGLVIRSTSAPTSTASIWVDTNFATPLAKVYDGATWNPIGCFQILTNKSGGSLGAGTVVVASTSTSSSFTTTTTADVPALGVLMETIADNATGVVATVGARVPALITNATVTRGQTLSTSTVAGKGTPSGVNAYAIALTPGTGATTITDAIIVGPSIVPANAGTSGQALTSAGPGATPTWSNPNTAKTFVQAYTTDASGSTAFTGFGKTPKSIICLSFFNSTGSGGTQGSWGFGAGASDQRQVSQFNGATTIDTTLVGRVVDNGGLGRTWALASFDADGFTLTHTKVGAVSNSHSILVIAQG